MVEYAGVIQIFLGRVVDTQKLIEKHSYFQLIDKRYLTLKEEILMFITIAVMDHGFLATVLAYIVL